MHVLLRILPVLWMVNGCAARYQSLLMAAPSGGEIVIAAGMGRPARVLPIPFRARVEVTGGEGGIPLQLMLPAAVAELYGGHGSVRLYGRLFVLRADDDHAPSVLDLPRRQLAGLLDQSINELHSNSRREDGRVEIPVARIVLRRQPE